MYTLFLIDTYQKGCSKNEIKKRTGNQKKKYDDDGRWQLAVTQFNKLFIIHRSLYLFIC